MDWAEGFEDSWPTQLASPHADVVSLAECLTWKAVRSKRVRTVEHVNIQEAQAVVNEVEDLALGGSDRGATGDCAWWTPGL